MQRMAHLAFDAEERFEVVCALGEDDSVRLDVLAVQLDCHIGQIFAVEVAVNC